MSSVKAVPVRPEDLTELSDQRLTNMNELIQRLYFPNLGYVEVTWEAVASALGISSMAPFWEASLKQVVDTYEKSGWGVTYRPDNFGGEQIIVRFEAKK
jgi:hypothetical protein